MKFICALTDSEGFTVSLEVSASKSYLGSSPEASKGLSADEDLVGSVFVRAIPQLSAQLEQVYLATGSILLSSLSKVLRDDCPETQPPQQGAQQ